MRTHPGRLATLTLVGLAALTLAILAVAGCGEVDGISGRNVVRIVSLNDNAPVASDVVIVNDDSTLSVPDDVIPITLEARVTDPVLEIDPAGPFGTVTFTSYDVDYEPEDLDGDSVPDLTDFTRPMHLVVPSGGSATGAIVLLTMSDKLRTPITCIGVGSGDPACAGNSDFQYNIDATITFHGTEETSGDEIVVVGTVQIVIADFADES